MGFNQGWRRFCAPAAAGAVSLALIAVPGAAFATESAQQATQLVRAVQADGPLMSYAINTAATRAAVQAAEQAVADAGGKVKVSYPQIGVVIAHSNDTEFVANIKALDPGIQSAGPTRTAAFTEPTPSLPFTPAPPATTQPNGVYGADMTAMNVDKAHKVTTGSRDVIVGVLDDGVDDTHSALAPVFDPTLSVSCIDNGGKVNTAPGSWRPWVYKNSKGNTVVDNHGTHVAGAIAANDIGQNMIGVAPGVRVAAVKLVNPDGYIYPEYAICGFVWAAEHGFSVTNNSYNVDPWFFWCADQPEQGPALEAVKRAIDYSTRRGVLNVAAAGNDNYDLANLKTENYSPNDAPAPIKNRPVVGCLDIPSQVPGVITVSATTNTKTKASFSSYGLGIVDVAAPGSSTRSTVPGGGYGNMSGTSMASPHVAGVAALLKSAHPHATPAQLTKMLHDQAQPLACPTAVQCQAPEGKDRLQPGYNGYFGYGLADALNAVTKDYVPTPGTGDQVIIAPVTGAPLTLEVTGTTISLPTTTLNGFDQVVSGAINSVKVVDPRGTAQGWNLVGQASDLVSASGVIVANNVGWRPIASIISGSLPTAPGQESEVVPGAEAAPGVGLGDARTLCSAGVGLSAGAFSCGGDLSLGIPGSTRAGTYTGVLTLTLI